MSNAMTSVSAPRTTMIKRTDKFRTRIKAFLSRLICHPQRLGAVNYVLAIAQSEGPLVPFRPALSARMTEWKRTSIETSLLGPLGS